MKTPVTVACIATLVLHACGEESTSRFQAAPELGSFNGDGGVDGDAGTKREPSASGGKVLEAQGRPASDTTPSPPNPECAAMAAKVRLDVETLGGVSVKSNETVSWPFRLPEVPGCPWKITLKPDPDAPTTDLGELVAMEGYRAPDVGQNSARVFLELESAASGAPPVRFSVRIRPSNLSFLSDDGFTQGAIANVYKLPDTTTKLPDFSNMTPLARLLSPNIDVPLRNYTLGVPGLEGLNEWFGIRYDFDLYLPADGFYEFAVESDDGAKLFVAGTLVLDNDGLHSSSRQESGPLEKFRAGRHALRLDYFQGPRDSLQVQLLWRTAPDASWEIVPSSAFRRPASAQEVAP